jgi:nitrate reductase alpha subunit
MSMVSYAAGARYLSLLGGVCMSFYDWYCDLPPSSPQTWGEQTDVPESADWYNAGFLMMWGSNVPQTRTPDAHFMTEARYRGTKVAVVSPTMPKRPSSPTSGSPQAGHRCRAGDGDGPCDPARIHLDRQAAYFEDYCRRYTDMPMLVRWWKRTAAGARTLRAADFLGSLARPTIPTGRPSPSTRRPTKWWCRRLGGFPGARRQVEPGGKGRARAPAAPHRILDGQHDEVVEVAFPISAIASTITSGHRSPERAERRVPVRRCN